MCLVWGGSGQGGGVPGPRGGAWSGGCTWSGGVCVCLVRGGGVSAPGGSAPGGIPACTEADPPCGQNS